MSPQEKYAATVAAKSKGRGNTGAFADTSQTSSQAKNTLAARKDYEPGPSNVSRFASFASSVGSSTLNIGKSIGGMGVDAAASTGRSIVDFGDAVGKTTSAWYQRDQSAIQQRIEQSDLQVEKAQRDYKAGIISKEQYQTELRVSLDTRKQANKQLNANLNNIQEDRDKTVEGAVNTAITILSAGSYASLSTVAKGSKFLGGTATTSKALFSKSGTAFIKAEELASKVPAVRALLTRNGAKFANTSRGVINQSVRDAAVGTLFKSPFLYHGTIAEAQDIFRDINEGQFNRGTIGKIAFATTMAFDGGILGAAQKFYSNSKHLVVTRTLGRSSMLDELSKKFKGGNPRAWVDWMDAAKTPAERAQRIKYLKITQEMNIQRWGSGEEAASGLSHYLSANEAIDIGQQSFDDFMDNQVKFLKLFEELDDFAGTGKLIIDGEVISRGKVAVGSFSREARESLIEKLSGMSYLQQAQYIDESTEIWAQNPVIKNKMLQAVHKASKVSNNKANNAAEIVEQASTEGKTYKVFRGSGGEKQIKTQNDLSILGNDKKYYAFDEETAGKFGKNIESTEVKLSNPLEITNDKQWREITKSAGNKYALPTGLSKAETQTWIDNLNKHIKAQGHDGVVVRMSKETNTDTSLIKDVFETDQVVPLTKARPTPKAPVESKTSGVGALATAIREIDTAEDLTKFLPKELAKRFSEEQRILIKPARNLNKFISEQNTRQIITDQIVEGSDFVGSISPIPVLSNLNGSLTRIGLSTKAANDVAYKQLFTNVTANLGDLPVMNNIVNQSVTKNLNIRASGRFILDTLQEYSTNKPSLLGGSLNTVNSISDVRQLRYGEIMEAMANKGVKISRTEAKQISRSLSDSYRELPLQLRGLGDRIVDNMFSYVPGFRTYNRAQSALRYTYNPFFRVQEEVETRILTRATSGNLIWGKSRAALNETADKLDEVRMFNTGFSGAGARDDIVLGRITANISKGQKRDLAGLAMKLADKKGVDIDYMIANHFDELEDALKVVVQYSSKGIISSPLARTLNLAFFPARYNAKVSLLAAKSLSKAPPVVQYSVINGILDSSNWLKSDEGILWQSENSEALGVLKWITPYGSIESVVNMLNGNVDSISDIGVLGGLPAGVIFQTLDSQGVFDNVPGPVKYGTPYVNPKTGEVYADKIPESVKAKTAVALGDFINSIFTYPGRVIGLPGKGQAIRTGVGAILDTDSKEYNYVDQEKDLTELQRRTSELLKNKSLDDMDHDELLQVFRTNDQWSTPNLAGIMASPKVREPRNKVELGREI